MTKTRQNLFLFFDESEYDSKCSSNLVKLAMNRFVVEEDAQFEVMGVYFLHGKVTEPMIQDLHEEFNLPENRKKRKEKRQFDENVFYHALNVARSIQSPKFRSHFIIGSLFYSLHTEVYTYGNWRFVGNVRRPQLVEWILEKMQQCDLHSLQCTFYQGFQEMPAPLVLVSPNGNKIPNVIAGLKHSVNEDLEQFIHEIQNDNQPKEHFQHSGHLRMHTEEFKETENNAIMCKSFWEKNLWSENLKFEEKLLKSMFVFCQRCTVQLE